MSPTRWTMSRRAATDFFTTQVWTQGGLVTYYVVFFIHLATRRVHIGRHHAASERTVDDPSGSQRDHGRCRLSVLEFMEGTAGESNS